MWQPWTRIIYKVCGPMQTHPWCKCNANAYPNETTHFHFWHCIVPRCVWALLRWNSEKLQGSHIMKWYVALVSLIWVISVSQLNVAQASRASCQFFSPWGNVQFAAGPPVPKCPERGADITPFNDLRRRRGHQRWTIFFPPRSWTDYEDARLGSVNVHNTHFSTGVYKLTEVHLSNNIQRFT